MRDTLITRNIDFETGIDDADNKYIQGRYIVFNQIYQICDGITESIAPDAFNDTINDDIRCLWNHNDDLILGRTTAGTLSLSIDSQGVYGRCLVNPNDQAAMDAYARVSRRDVTGASFGFDILAEDTEVRDDGSVHYYIRKVQLYEISPCIFPAYNQTAIEARQRDVAIIRKRQADIWRTNMLDKLHTNILNKLKGVAE